MARKTWEISLEGKTHRIELEHGYFSGEKSIRVDGLPLPAVGETSKLLDFGGDFPFLVATHPCFIRIKTNGLTFNYELFVDGTSRERGGQSSPAAAPTRKNKIPRAWGRISNKEEALGVIRYTAKLLGLLALLNFALAFFALAFSEKIAPYLSETRPSELAALALLSFVLYGAYSLLLFFSKNFYLTLSMIFLMALNLIGSLWGGVAGLLMGGYLFWMSIRVMVAARCLRAWAAEEKPRLA